MMNIVIIDTCPECIWILYSYTLSRFLFSIYGFPSIALSFFLCATRFFSMFLLFASLFL